MCVHSNARLKSKYLAYFPAQGVFRALGTNVISSDRLQLSYSKLGVWGLSIWHFQQADLESAPQHDNLWSLSAVLGIG
jgi:hypothetical protein